MDNYRDNRVVQAMLSRRSVRKYRPDLLEESLLTAILEAGRHAPSGGNNQSSRFLVVQNPRRLEELKALVVEEFSKMEIQPDTYKSLVHSIQASKKGGYDFIFGAPTLVVLSNRRGYGNAMADCAVALENMLVAAHALGAGGCWINQLRWLSDNPAVVDYLEKLGIPRDEVVCGAASLGYSAQPQAAPLPRTGNPVVYVR